MGMFDALVMNDYSGLQPEQAQQAQQAANMFQLALGLMGANKRGVPFGQAAAGGLAAGMGGIQGMEKARQEQEARTMQLQQAHSKLLQEAAQQRALNTIFGGVDDKGIAWNTGRPGMTGPGGLPTSQGMVALGAAFPETFAKGAIEQLFTPPGKGLPPGMRIGANGQPEWIPGYLEGQTGIRQAGAPQVNVDTAGNTLSPPPAGYAYQRAPTGKIAVDEKGAPTLVPMSGGPAAMSAAEKAAAAAVKAQDAQDTADLVSEDIDRTIKIIGSTPVTGLFSVASTIPGTPAHNAAELLSGIVANIGMDNLKALRASSPTGASGLGQVTNFEEQLLQKLKGSLVLTQTKEQLLYNLDRVSKIFSKMLTTRMTPRDPLVREFLSSLGGASAALAAGTPPGAPERPINEILKSLGVPGVQ